MNIRFLAQFEYFNGVHLKDDIILEKEYEAASFENVPKVHYYLYYLEENVRKEVMPYSDKVDIFQITDCVYDSDYLYFTEYNDMLDGTYTFNIIKYNFTDHTHKKIITLKDDINLYPNNKQIKIFILDDSNLIVQRAMPKKSTTSSGIGFHDFSLILFNFDKNKQIVIKDEELNKSGIDFITPYSENNCIVKTGYSIFDSGVSSEEDASIEKLLQLNISQFISDLQLEDPSLVYNTIDQCFYDNTILKARMLEGYLIYSKYNHDDNEESIIFYNLETKESYKCINKSTHKHSMLNFATIIDEVPYMLMKGSSGTQFLNLFTDEVDNVYPPDYDIQFVNNTTIVSTVTEKNFWNKPKDYVAIIRYPSKKVILEERGDYIGAIASNKDTTYIFLK